MAKVHVKAIQMGYYDNKRIREGQVFHFDDSLCKIDSKGKKQLPKWVVPVSSREPVVENAKAVVDKSDDVI